MSLRSLRSNNLLIDTSSEEEDDYKEAKASSASTVPITSPPQSKEERGLPLEVQKQLFEKIDAKGGLDVVSNTT